MLFVIAGHGAGDSGAVGGGHNEADLVRRLAAKMKELGGANIEVLDTSIDWYRSKTVNAALKAKVGNNPVIEFHMDSGGAGARGGHVIIAEGLSPDADDNRLAQNIAAMFPGRSQTIIKRGNLANINRAKTHGINYRLLEVCFISDNADRNKFINQMDDVARTILAAFGINTQKGWLDMLSDAEQRELLDKVRDIHWQVCSNRDESGRGITMPPLEQLRFMAGKQQTILENTEKILDESKTKE